MTRLSFKCVGRLDFGYHRGNPGPPEPNRPTTVTLLSHCSPEISDLRVKEMAAQIPPAHSSAALKGAVPFL